MEGLPTNNLSTRTDKHTRQVHCQKHYWDGRSSVIIARRSPREDRCLFASKLFLLASFTVNDTHPFYQCNRGKMCVNVPTSQSPLLHGTEIFESATHSQEVNTPNSNCFTILRTHSLTVFEIRGTWC
jgi:hypothetical protein